MLNLQGETGQRQNKVALANINYLTNFSEWLKVQEGNPDSDGNTFNDLAENNIAPGVAGSLFEHDPRYICTLRDLTTYVHFDALYEAYLNACLILLGMPARVDPGNPYLDEPRYRTQRTQDGFATFGPPHILTLVTEVATRALKAVWFQKWGVHRRLRPEEFGGRIQVHLVEDSGRYNGMINKEILDSLSAAGKLALHFPMAGGYLLPQAFKEGAPTHPAYGAGHATVAGACVTVLKAWFDESEVFDPSVVPAVIPGVPGPVRNQMAENRRPKEPDPADPTCRTLRNVINPPILTVGVS
ncbi:MAG: hypothetical protein H0W62_02055 [Chitinophagales bacterium]|nr:hypothetical protein [Chitinophagales bacterium]